MKFTASLGAIFLTSLCLSSAARASSLVAGYALDCPEHVGTRLYRTQTLSAGDTEVYIVSQVKRDDAKKCDQTIEFHIKTEAREKVFRVEDVRYFNIADISADGQWFLLERDGDSGDEDYGVRTKELAVINIANPEPHWRNVWDILGWDTCKAKVVAESLSESGVVVVYLGGANTNRGAETPDRSNDCVNQQGHYQVDLATGAKRMVADEIAVPRAKVSGYDYQNCKTNPDIVGSCFKIRGRISEWNGSLTTRIWPVGTNRVLALYGTLPGAIKERYSFDVNVFADLEVCPFEKDAPGEMRLVCIESAKNIRFEERLWGQ